MKKILIFYGSYGSGHLSAARSIKECIDSNYTDVETILIDCVESINKHINKISTKAYYDLTKRAPLVWKKIYYSSGNGYFSYISNAANKIMSHKFIKVINEYNPNLIISTHPFSSQMCAILKKRGKLNCMVATIMTDYAPHNQWLVENSYIDYFFVAHNGMKKELCKCGIPEKKIYATGIPLSNRFLMHYDKFQTLKDFGLKPDKTTVLFFANGSVGIGKSKTFEILESLIELFPNFQIVAIAGKNAKTKKRFDGLVENTHSESSVKILEYTNKVAELMSVSDLVISKPRRSYYNRKLSIWFAYYCN